MAPRPPKLEPRWPILVQVGLNMAQFGLNMAQLGPPKHAKTYKNLMFLEVFGDSAEWHIGAYLTPHFLHMHAHVTSSSQLTPTCF